MSRLQKKESNCIPIVVNVLVFVLLFEYVMKYSYSNTLTRLTSNSSTVFGKVGYYEHRPGGSTLKNVLIIPTANLLILATVVWMFLNDNISNYILGRLYYRTLK